MGGLRLLRVRSLLLRPVFSASLAWLVSCRASQCARVAACSEHATPEDAQSFPQEWKEHYRARKQAGMAAPTPIGSGRGQTNPPDWKRQGRPNATQQSGWIQLPDPRHQPTRRLKCQLPQPTASKVPGHRPTRRLKCRLPQPTSKDPRHQPTRKNPRHQPARKKPRHQPARGMRCQLPTQALAYCSKLMAMSQQRSNPSPRSFQRSHQKVQFSSASIESCSREQMAATSFPSQYGQIGIT